MFFELLSWWRLRGYKRRGLQIADDCVIRGVPNFGSEPYLISIGKRVRMASRVTLITHDGGTRIFRNEPRYLNIIKFGRITIHDNCFLGFGATIMPGVSIGPNSVVAAGAVVTRDVPPNTVVGGVPAKVLMTVEEYAEKSLAQMPEYNLEAYQRDKMAELLRIFPRPW